MFKKEEAVRAAGRLPIHFVRGDDVVACFEPFLSNVQLLVVVVVVLLLLLVVVQLVVVLLLVVLLLIVLH